MSTRWIQLLVLLLFPFSGTILAEVSAKELPEMHGLCVTLGADYETVAQIAKSREVLLHVMHTDRETVRDLQRRLLLEFPDASITVEHWSKNYLPHAENIANFVVVDDKAQVEQVEVERILAPGGRGFLRNNDDYAEVKKAAGGVTDEWTHQWHGIDGGLTTDDEHVGVPRGVQWLSGPLFAMAGRKSSTQTLVSAGGLNFYITQNVLENVGLATDEMRQYLVARDAYNGLVRWQRPWTGTFVTGNGETNPRMVAAQGKLYATTQQGLLCLDPSNGHIISDLELVDPVDKLLVLEERVLIQQNASVLAFDLELSKQLWSFHDKRLSGLVASELDCFLIASGRSDDGRFQHDLICLRIKDGQLQWRTNTQPFVEAARVRINFAVGDFRCPASSRIVGHVFITGRTPFVDTENRCAPWKDLR